jgi:hypothetical protein
VHTLNGFFNLSTWLTTIVGVAILLGIFHLFGRSAPAVAGADRWRWSQGSVREDLEFSERTVALRVRLRRRRG